MNHSVHTSDISHSKYELKLTFAALNDTLVVKINKKRKRKMALNTALLDKYNIPHYNGEVDIELWAISNNYMLIDNSIWDKNGKRAIAYAPNYGAGWSTWNEDGILPAADTTANMILLAMGEDNRNEADYKEIYCHIKKIPLDTNLCLLALDDVIIEWTDISKGKLRITEYDGAESIEYQEKSESTWF